MIYCDAKTEAEPSQRNAKEKYADQRQQDVKVWRWLLQMMRHLCSLVGGGQEG